MDVAGVQVTFGQELSTSGVKYGRQKKTTTKFVTQLKGGAEVSGSRDGELRICLGGEKSGAACQTKGLQAPRSPVNLQTWDGEKSIMRSLSSRGSLSVVKTVGLTSRRAVM